MIQKFGRPTWATERRVHVLSRTLPGEPSPAARRLTGNQGRPGGKGVSMRGAPVIAAVVIGTAAVLSGCGQQHGTGGGVAAPAPSASSAAGPGATGPGPSGSCPGGRPATHGKLTITLADGGRSFCVTRGANVAVFLRGTAARKWSPVHATGGVLRP